MADNPAPRRPDKPDAMAGFERQWPWLLLMLFGIYYLLSQSQVSAPKPLDYTELLRQVDGGKVDSVELRGLELRGRYRQSSGDSATRFDFTATIPALEDRTLLDRLADNGVKVSVRPDQSPVWLQLLVGFIPWVLIFLFLIYSSRAMRGRMGGLFEFGRSKARRYQRVEGLAIGFDQIAGSDNAKRDLQEIIDYLKNPERFRKLGAHMPRGVLMMGPPGTGKTLLAKATAAEAGVPFFSISGSEFIEMYVGVGASRVREMFAQARREAPALIFIDEIDSVGRMRGTGLGGGNDEREQTLNQILAEMDGFDAREIVVVLAATNRPDVLDPALLRPGRFDRKVVLELPGRAARRAILDVHLRKVPLADDVDVDAVAGASVGFSGADLANLVNEAALRAARENRDRVTAADLDSARDRVLLGERRDNLLDADERRRVACHEAGHAVAAWFLPEADPLEKVSIVPRGRALGITEQRAEGDRYTVTQEQLQQKLSILLGGRCAERLFYGGLSSGAADDLKQAMQIARRMVAQWGMSGALGPVSYPVAEEHPFLGREMATPRDFSEETAKLIDDEVRVLLREAEARTVELLTRHRAGLDALIEALLSRESLDKSEIAALLGAPVRTDDCCKKEEQT